MEISPLRHRSNDIVSGLIHLAGVGVSIAVLVILVVLASRDSDVWHIVGYALYGAGLILLYLASASYHLVPNRWVRCKRIAQRLDHAMIYILIAATYMPVVFIALDGGWRWSMFGSIWGLAIIGLSFKLLDLSLAPPLSAGLYLLMGWLIAIAASPLIQNMSQSALWLLLLGGVSYTLGIVFFALESVLPQRKYFWMHEIFHLFVLGGSALHTVLMFQLL